jgi:4-amino-4-deoxy-L-arabinose transferase-like glycosyltransferase
MNGSTDSIGMGGVERYAAPRAGGASWAVSDRVVCGALVACVIALYAPMYHRYWTIGGDGDVFLAVARSLVLGEGYRFNGQPVAIIPPGWPWVLAGALQLTSKFATLKLIPAACLVGFVATSYWVLRRFTTPLGAAACVLVSALLEPIFGLAFLFYSDPLFALLCMLALLLAMRVNEGDVRWRTILPLVALCSAAVLVRWTGILWCGVVAGALAAGDVHPRANRRWAAIGLCIFSALATFLILRTALRVDASEVDPRYDAFVAEHYDLFNMEDTAHDQVGRLRSAGRWIGGLLWRVIEAIRDTRELANVAGWVAMAPLAVTLYFATRRRQWLALACAAYLGILVVNWPNPMPRYIIPLAPLLLLALVNGIVRMGQLLPQKLRDVRWLVVHYVVASIVLCQLILYGIEVNVARAEDVHALHQAGLNEELLDAARWLNRQAPDGREIAVTSIMDNMGKTYVTDGFRRATNLLTNRAIVTVPPELCREPDDELIAWARRHNVRYYLYQPPIRLIRHFHRAGWHAQPPDKSTTAWRLYEFRGDQVWRLIVPHTRRWPDRVPGM